MISLENKRLKIKKNSLLCEMYNLGIGRNGKKKINMTKIASRKNAKRFLKRPHLKDKKIKFTEKHYEKKYKP